MVSSTTRSSAVGCSEWPPGPLVAQPAALTTICCFRGALPGSPGHRSQRDWACCCKTTCSNSAAVDARTDVVCFSGSERKSWRHSNYWSTAVYSCFFCSCSDACPVLPGVTIVWKAVWACTFGANFLSFYYHCLLLITVVGHYSTCILHQERKGKEKWAATCHSCSTSSSISKWSNWTSSDPTLVICAYLPSPTGASAKLLSILLLFWNSRIATWGPLSASRREWSSSWKLYQAPEFPDFSDQPS